LLFVCYFPLNCGWLAWVALVPLLCLVRGGASNKRVFLCAWAGGLAFFWPVLQWMRVADTAMYATWAVLATYCALYVPAGILLARLLDRSTRLPLVVTLPVVWTALEFLRSHLATGFTWYLLGHSQHAFLPVIQVTDLGGVYAVSVLVAAVNALLFEVLYARPWFRRFLALPEPVQPTTRRSLLAQGVAVAVLLAGSLGYGEWRLHRDDFEVGPKVALVQSNLDLRLKNEAWSGEPGADKASEAMRSQQIRLTDLAAPPRPDLVVWPETSWPDEWVERQDAGAERLVPADFSLKLAEGTSQRWHTDLLLGLNTLVVAPDDRILRRYNSAVLVTSDGQPGGRYDKIHCVPFGEYVPLRDWLPFMKWFSPYNFDYSIRPGENLTRFRLGQYHYGVLICYEDSVSDLARNTPCRTATGRPRTSCSTRPTTAGSTALPSTRSTWPSAVSAPSRRGAAWHAASTWASRRWSIRTAACWPRRRRGRSATPISGNCPLARRTCRSAAGANSRRYTACLSRRSPSITASACTRGWATGCRGAAGWSSAPAWFWDSCAAGGRRRSRRIDLESTGSLCYTRTRLAAALGAARIHRFANR